jgi:hypothetical protein
MSVNRGEPSRESDDCLRLTMTCRLGRVAARHCDKCLAIGCLMFGASVPIRVGQRVGGPERMRVKSTRRSSVLSDLPVPGFFNHRPKVGLDSDAMPERGTVRERGNDGDPDRAKGKRSVALLAEQLMPKAQQQLERERHTVVGESEPDPPWQVTRYPPPMLRLDH